MTTRRLISVAVFTALITVGGLISFPIPFTGIEISLQTVFVIFAGLLLGPRDGALAVLVYIAMGLLGLPVFTRGGGIAYVFQPSFGYLIGFPIGAAVAGLINRRGKTPTVARAFFSALMGMIPVYVIGISYQVLIVYYYTGSAWAATIGQIPAVLVLYVKDGVLLGLVATAYPPISRALRAIGHGGSRGDKKINANNDAKAR